MAALDLDFAPANRTLVRAGQGVGYEHDRAYKVF